MPPFRRLILPRALAGLLPILVALLVGACPVGGAAWALEAGPFAESGAPAVASSASLAAAPTAPAEVGAAPAEPASVALDPAKEQAQPA